MYTGRREPVFRLPCSNLIICLRDVKANLDFDIGSKTFASGLPELIAAPRRSRPGDLVAITAAETSIGVEMETRCRFTGHDIG
jgi:hypothetical protein